MTAARLNLFSMNYSKEKLLVNHKKEPVTVKKETDAENDRTSIDTKGDLIEKVFVKVEMNTEDNESTGMEMRILRDKEHIAIKEEIIDESDEDAYSEILLSEDIKPKVEQKETSIENDNEIDDKRSLVQYLEVEVKLEMNTEDNEANYFKENMLEHNIEEYLKRDVKKETAIEIDKAISSNVEYFEKQATKESLHLQKNIEDPRKQFISSYLLCEVCNIKAISSNFKLINDRNVCSKCVMSRKDIKQNTPVHSYKSVKCDECDKTFTRKSSLIVHLRKHAGIKPFTCNKCKKTFTRKSVLKIHMQIHTGKKPFNCTSCDKTFSQRGLLNSHIRIHTGEKPFICKVCDMAFIFKLNLTNHMRIHTGERSPYACNSCDTTFTTKWNLSDHLRIHSGEKPYVCSVCNKTFRTAGTLSKHTTVHSNERPFDCKICGKTFKEKRCAKDHMFTHTGEKPFICTTCSKCFSKANTLRKHMKTHGAKPTYACDKCEKVYKTGKTLKKHYKRLHSEENKTDLG